MIIIGSPVKEDAADVHFTIHTHYVEHYAVLNKKGYLAKPVLKMK